MLLQEITANTDGYMIAGYAVSFIVMALYVASIYVRNRNLQRDLATLEEMDKQAVQAKAGPKKTAKPVTKRGNKKYS